MSYKFDKKKHIHLLDGSPLYGTSTVIKEVMPPFLAKWGAQCAVDFIRAIPQAQINGTWCIGDEVLEKAILAWSKVRKEAAGKGVDLHASLEGYIKLMMSDQDGKPTLMNDAKEEDPAWSKVQEFAKWSVLNVEKFLLSEAYTFSKELWTGGIVDCVAKLKDGRLAVIDFKSSKEAYFNQFVQAAGYALQLEESGAYEADGSFAAKLDAPVSILFVVPFGAKEFVVESIENLKEYKESFKSVVQVYGLLNSFNTK